MHLSRSFYTTQKELPAEATSPSHKLMLRAGMIQQIASGIYNYLPLALRCIRKVENIIREELDKRGCEEVLLPTVLPAELWKSSGRWDIYGDLLLRARDRKGSQYCIGPTHEEVITDMVRRNLKSWKQLPWNLYQIQGKFRDEYRPRFGLMRGREFIMKDAYSFDTDQETAKKSYWLMYEAYQAIFRRFGLDFRSVDANAGEIGGDMSQEFQVLAKTGEDLILSCNSCGYSANVEKAVAGRKAAAVRVGQAQAMETIDTPDSRTVEEVASFLSIGKDRILKSLIYTVSGTDESENIMVVVAGDRDVNEVKLGSYLGGRQVKLIAEDSIRALMNASAGSLGPVNIPDGLRIYADYSVERAQEWFCGANQDGKHLGHVLVGRDFQPCEFADLSFARAGDLCSRCESASGRDCGFLEESRGIEVGHVFYLGEKYSRAMGCIFLDDKGCSRPAVMGCYGIGVGRTMAAAIEQKHDESGIIWPVSIAPWELVILPLQTGHEEVEKAAEKLYVDFCEAGVEVVLDDRNERAGVKFADADLTGYPVQVILGIRNLVNGKVEVKFRESGEREILDLHEVLPGVVRWIAENK